MMLVTMSGKGDDFFLRIDATIKIENDLKLTDLSSPQ